MIATRIERKEECSTLVLDGDLIVDHAEELKNIFLDILETADSLSLNLEGVNKADLFGLQVLCSAHRSFLKAGKELHLAGKHPAAFREAILAAGYDRTFACCLDRTCPWKRV